MQIPPRMQKLLKKPSHKNNDLQESFIVFHYFLVFVLLFGYIVINQVSGSEKNQKGG